MGTDLDMNTDMALVGLAGGPPGQGKRIGVVDVTVRDGHQSLWATRMRNATILGFAERMDDIGFERIDLVGGAVFDVCVRYLKEDPWERMRLVRQVVRRTPLQMWVRGQSLFTFEIFPDDVVRLAIQRAVANGIRHLQTYDCINEVRNLDTVIGAARAEGLPVTGALVFTLSPVHTDAYFAGVAEELVRQGVDALCLKDPSGLLSPERVKTLVPALRRVAGQRTLELHTHALSGLAPLCLLEGVQRGVDLVHTAISPLAHGASHAPTETVARNLRYLGYETGLDESGLAEMAAYFTRAAHQEGQPVGGTPAEFDPALYDHQIPGGMLTNLKIQLRELGIQHRLGEVLEENGRIRVELGYPPMVSPISQVLITQAVLNVLHGERYRTFPLELRAYVLGHYGRPAGPIAPDVLDRVGGGAEPYAGRPADLVPPALAKTRAERGPFASEEDLLTAVFYADDVCQALFAARAAAAGRYENPYSTQPPVARLLMELAGRPGLGRVNLQLGDLRLTATR